MPGYETSNQGIIIQSAEEGSVAQLVVALLIGRWLVVGGLLVGQRKRPWRPLGSIKEMREGTQRPSWKMESDERQAAVCHLSSKCQWSSNRSSCSRRTLHVLNSHLLPSVAGNGLRKLTGNKRKIGVVPQTFLRRCLEFREKDGNCVTSSSTKVNAERE